MQYSPLRKPTEHFKLLHPSQIPVWGFLGHEKLKEDNAELAEDEPTVRSSAQRQQPLPRRKKLSRTSQRDPQRVRATTAVRSRVLDLPQSDH